MSEKCKTCGSDNKPEKHCRHYEVKAQSSLAAPSGYRAAIRNAELICATSPCQTVVIIRREDEIVIRDNSGVEGLTSEPLMHKIIALLEEIFERDNEKVSDRPH